jgi:phosphoribosyl 1,2-cyclic phosphate phosphodiesterase
MRFTFLGTGTSAGVPLIACSCGVCTSGDPRDKRLRTSACLEFVDGTGVERVVLIDCGPDLRQQALRAGLRRCDAVVFTHNHVDHTFGVDELRRFNAAMRGPIDVYAEAHTMEHLRRVYRHIFESALNVNQSFVATLIPHVIDEGTPLELFGGLGGGGVRLVPIRLLHGRLPILGFRIESGLPGAGEVLPLAYCTDVSAIPPGSWGRLRGLKTLVLDALRPRHHPTHLTIDQAIGVAERVKAEQTYFVHMSHDVSHGELEPRLPEGVALAYDGLVLGGGVRPAAVDTRKVDAD